MKKTPGDVIIRGGGYGVFKILNNEGGGEGEKMSVLMGG